jgi:leucyl-tRNA synthetase
VYNHNLIEKHWQRYWQEKKVNVFIDSNKPKYYVLDMFPYPSGSGLHVGHLKGYVPTDIIARFKKLNGFDVLHPIG